MRVNELRRILSEVSDEESGHEVLIDGEPIGELEWDTESKTLRMWT